MASLYCDSDLPDRPGRVCYLFGSSLFRFGLRRFERRLCDLLCEGWQVDHVEVCHWGWLRLRLAMFARLYKPPATGPDSQRT